jgi:hypothetical protein
MPRSRRRSRVLGRYRGATRQHTKSDLRIFLSWCSDQELDPLAAKRADIEQYLRWLQDMHCYPALDGLAALGGRDRLLPRVRYRPGPAALAGRLRPPAARATRISPLLDVREFGNHPSSGLVTPSPVSVPLTHGDWYEKPHRALSTA